MPATPEPQQDLNPGIAQPPAVIESTAAAPQAVDEAASRWTLVFRRLLRKRLAMLGLAIVLLLFVVAYLSPYFVRWQYNQLDTNAFLTPPSSEHWFGTTQNGFDMFALTMRGMQKSLIIGVLGALMSTTLAAVIGA